MFYPLSQKLIQYFQVIINVLLSFILTIATSFYWLDYFAVEHQIYAFSIAILLLYIILQMMTTYIFQRYLIKAKHLFFTEQPAAFTTHTTDTLKQWHSDVIKYVEQHKALDNPLIFLYDWRTKRYVAMFSDTLQPFPANHALAYITRQQQAGIIDAKIISQLPEVIGLDIQFLLKQYGADAAIPLGVSSVGVCGFVVGTKNNLGSQEVEVIQKKYGKMLEQILQHDALINPANPVAAKPSHLSWPIGVTILTFILLTIWWILMPTIQYINSSKLVYNFSNIYGVMAVWGGIWGLIAAQCWQKQKNIRYALCMFSLGLFLQEFGQATYAIHNWIWNIQIPYPSIGDVGFFGSIPCYIFGVIFLAKACGVQLRLKSYKNIIIALVIPSLMLFFGYYLFLRDYTFDWEQPIKVLLDFGYPLTQAIYVSLAILTYLLTRDSGGKMKNLVLMILLALIWQFICDYTFLYQAYHNAWVVNGINDYMYFIAYFLMALILINFSLENTKKIL